jgi:hypothetical protein
MLNSPEGHINGSSEKGGDACLYGYFRTTELKAKRLYLLSFFRVRVRCRVLVLGGCMGVR